MPSVALTFVIPLFHSADTIGPVVREIESLSIPGGHEIVLVNDGSTDATSEVCQGLVRSARVPITLVEHARNYGEHNAVVTGWRHARGAHIVNLDDDGQNPPAEAVRCGGMPSRPAWTSSSATTRTSGTPRSATQAAG